MVANRKPTAETRSPAPPRRDFNRSPLLVFYETTRACDLTCLHCRACAQPNRHPNELTPVQTRLLIDQLVSFPTPPLLVLTGGDPLKRPDLEEIVRCARSAGLKVALTPSATPLVTLEALQRLQRAGVDRLAISLDGADAATHDAHRGVAGSFDQTMRTLQFARRLGLPVQINTTVSARNVHQVDAMANRLSGEGIVLWSVFFLVPVGRGLRERRLTADQCEEVFARLWRQSLRQPYAIKTTEAPHYRRFVMQQLDERPASFRPGMAGAGRRFAFQTLGVGDGRGVMFIGHTGQVYPSGFLPIECGRFPRDSVVRVYQESPLFRALRDPRRLKGKCGACGYREICGGSRARARAVTGDPLESEPDCRYIPAGWQRGN